jgi:hypothetical protein
MEKIKSAKKPQTALLPTGEKQDAKKNSKKADAATINTAKKDLQKNEKKIEVVTANTLQQSKAGKKPNTALDEKPSMNKVTKKVKNKKPGSSKGK